MADNNSLGSPKISSKPLVSSNNFGEDEVPFPKEEIQRLEARKWILSYAKKGGVGAEIGVFRGHFSAVLVNVLQPKRLYLVDPWRKLGKDFGWGKDSLYTAFGSLTTEYAYRDTARRMSNFDGTDIIIQEEFATDFFGKLSEKLDWVYLDASHAYAATLEELKLIDKVLKEDGVILGDDWHSARHHKHHGVYQAIHAFMKSYHYEIIAAGPAAQWCLRRGLVSSSSDMQRSTQMSSWVLHAALDIPHLQLMPGQRIDICGVVVLKARAPKDLKLCAYSDHHYVVDWNISSPWMSRIYENSPNGKSSRFRVHDVQVTEKMPVELYLEDREGTKEVVFRIH